MAGPKIACFVILWFIALHRWGFKPNLTHAILENAQF